jgi:hypothetical protein
MPGRGRRLDPPTAPHAKNDPLPQLMRAAISSFAFVRKPTHTHNYIYDASLNVIQNIGTIGNPGEVERGLAEECVTIRGTLSLTFCSSCKTVA